MKRLIIFVVLGAFFCAFFIGCHTLDTLSRVNTGRVGFEDLLESLVADDHDFQETFW